MESKKKEKNNSNVALIVIIVILSLAIVCLCGYIFLGKGNSNSTKYIIENNAISSKDGNEKQGDQASSRIVFDGSKSVNSSIKDYTLSSQGNAGIFVTVDSTQKVLTFSYTPTKVVENYPLNWTSDRIDVAKSNINFDKKIIDVFFGGMGQDVAHDTLFILLEDGTVEYIPIVHMFNHVQAEVVSYGKINGVSDVVKFTLSSTSSGVTTLAIKSDGTFYDLWYALKDTGNY